MASLPTILNFYCMSECDEHTWTLSALTGLPSRRAPIAVLYFQAAAAAWRKALRPAFAALLLFNFATVAAARRNPRRPAFAALLLFSLAAVAAARLVVFLADLLPF